MLKMSGKSLEPLSVAFPSWPSEFSGDAIELSSSPAECWGGFDIVSEKSGASVGSLMVSYPFIGHINRLHEPRTIAIM